MQPTHWSLPHHVSSIYTSSEWVLIPESKLRLHPSQRLIEWVKADLKIELLLKELWKWCSLWKIFEALSPHPQESWHELSFILLYKKSLGAKRSLQTFAGLPFTVQLSMCNKSRERFVSTSFSLTALNPHWCFERREMDFRVDSSAHSSGVAVSWDNAGWKWWRLLCHLLLLPWISC